MKISAKNEHKNSFYMRLDRSVSEKGGDDSRLRIGKTFQTIIGCQKCRIVDVGMKAVLNQKRLSAAAFGRSTNNAVVIILRNTRVFTRSHSDRYEILQMQRQF